VKRIPFLDDIGEINRLHRLMIAAELAAVHRKWFGKYSDLYRPRTAEIIREGAGVSPAQLRRARKNRLRLRGVLSDMMNRSGVDLWISPSAPGTAPKGIQSTGDPAMNLPWTHAGVPTVNVPAGFSEKGLPFGLQLSSGFQDDEYLLAAAERIIKIVDFAG
jgi:Asp-tRNA(Asn)/Glu-tRNA(Gln) amidotransferase A subunit family amidase